MNDMKNYKRAMDKVRVSDSVRDDLFRELDAQQETRRIVKHSAWQKPAAAAAVAAVVGLNVFAIMKLRGDVPVTPGNSQGSGEFVPVDVELPDLSAFGVDMDSFEQQQQPLVDANATDSAYRWYYKEEQPAEQWTYYVNKQNSILTFDAKGRFRSYTAPDDITEHQYSSDPTAAAAIDSNMRSFLSAAAPAMSFDGIGFVTGNADETEWGWWQLGMEQFSGGWVIFNTTNAGEILGVTLRLHDTPDESTYSAEEYDAAAQRLVGRIAYQGEGEIISKYFITFAGKIYGMYDVLMGMGASEENVAYGTYYLMVSPEGTLPDAPQNPQESDPQQPEEPENGLPDLSQYGIDTSDFAFTAENRDVLAAEWLYTDAEAPQFVQRAYINSAGDTMTLDEYGRVLNYQRMASQPIPNTNTEARKNLKMEILKAVTSPNAVVWADDDNNDAYGSYFYISYSWVHEVPANDGTTNATAYVRKIKAHGYVLLAEDNSITAFGIDYRTAPEQYQPYTDEAYRLAEENFGVTNPQIKEQLYYELGDQIYGVYTVVISGDGEHNLIVRAEQTYSFEEYGIPGRFKKQETQEQLAIEGIWLYTDADAPAITCDVYTTEAGAKLWVDSEGRPIRYQAPKNLVMDSMIHDENEIYEKARALTESLTGAETADIAKKVTDGNRTACICMADSSNQVFAQVDMMLLYDGGIESFYVDYLDWQDAEVTDEAAAAFDAEALRMSDELIRIDGELYRWFFNIGGETYAVYLTYQHDNGIRNTENRLIVRQSGESGIRADLSVFGIHTGEFRFVSEERKPLQGEWYVGNRDVPELIIRTYQNAAGDTIKLDAMGNLTEYTRNPDTEWQQGASISKMDASSRMRAIAQGAVAQEDPMLSAREDQINAGPSENGVTDWRHYFGGYYILTYGGMQAYAFVELAQDGTVQTVVLEYKPQNTEVYLEEAERLAYNYGNPKCTSEHYHYAGGADGIFLYGVFTFETDSGDHNIIVP